MPSTLSQHPSPCTAPGGSRTSPCLGVQVPGAVPPALAAPALRPWASPSPPAPEVSCRFPRPGEAEVSLGSQVPAPATEILTTASHVVTRTSQPHNLTSGVGKPQPPTKKMLTGRRSGHSEGCLGSSSQAPCWLNYMLALGPRQLAPPVPRPQRPPC